MLLIHPPVAKPSEPPAGIASLAGALRAHGVRHRLLDGNLEGQLFLFLQPCSATDTWSRRAAKNASLHLERLKTRETYGSFDRYSRAVTDLNRVLAMAGKEQGVVVGLADCHSTSRSPVRSSDLIAVAEHPETDPFFPWFSRRLAGLLAAEPTSVVGFSLNYLSQALTTFAMIGFLKRYAPQVTVIVGGGLVTSWLRQPGWCNPFRGLVDELVDGPGEPSLLARAGHAADATGFLPDYTGLPVGDYLSPGFVLPYSAASGCWWNRCSFCPERAEGNRYRPVPVGQVVAGLRQLTVQLKPALIHLLDNAVSPAVLRRLAAEPPGAPWYGFARIDDSLADPDFCRALRRSGCVMLKLGLESGDQDVLDRLGKGIDLGTASKVLGNLKEAGIATYVYLLFGTPAETEASARRTLQFVAGHGEEIGFLNLALFNMPVGGEGAEELGTRPFYEGDLSLYTAFRHPEGWDRKLARRFVNGEFSRHPAVAGILRRDPPIFTSNHAPFFL